MFFFQAEDGIRDIGVTGVQTCALPIFTSAIIASEGSLSRGLGQSAGFGLVGILLLGIAFLVIDLITPGKLGDTVTGDRHEPMVYVLSASLVSVGGIVAAAIS